MRVDALPEFVRLSKLLNIMIIRCQWAEYDDAE
jgi:hypothetical protein